MDKISTHKSFILGITLIALISILYVIRIFGARSGIDSLYDEGYLLLKLWEARNEIGQQGVSQWPVMVFKLLGSDMSANLLYLRYVEITLQILSVLYLIRAVYKWYSYSQCNNKNSLLFGISFILLLQYPTLGALFIYYNPIQQLLFNLIIANVILYQRTNEISKSVYLLLAGLCSFLSFLVILPSGVVVSLLILIYLFVINDYNVMKTFSQSVFYILGIVIAALLYHFFVNNLLLVYNEMKEVAGTITKTGRGYDISTFIIKYLVYFKDILLSILPLIFAFGLSVFVNKYNKILSILVFVISIVLINLYWPWAKAMYSTMILFPALVGFVVYVFSKNIHKPILSLLIFLLVFPFLGLLGTNVYYGGKIVWFFISWSIVLLILMSTKLKSKFLDHHKHFFILSVLVLYLFFPVRSLFGRDNNKYLFEKYNQISGIKITQSQLIYFNRVDSIITKYGYKPNMHYMFSTQLDHMTIYVLNARPNSTYFQPMDFVVDENSFKLIKPEFLFLTKYDLDVAGEKLINSNWGFPDAYDKYYVGTPETVNTGYPTERWLYCLKSLRQNK